MIEILLNMALCGICTQRYNKVISNYKVCRPVPLQCEQTVNKTVKSNKWNIVIETENASVKLNTTANDNWHEIDNADSAQLKSTAAGR